MKVIYFGQRNTYHPKLGKLIAGKPFELDEKQAKKYIASDLLKAASKKNEQPVVTVREQPATSNEQRKKGVKHGKSTNR